MGVVVRRVLGWGGGGGRLQQERRSMRTGAGGWGRAGGVGGGVWWKHPVTVIQINREYSLREDDRWVFWGGGAAHLESGRE